ncbi:MAG: DUF3987 domain-containing protein [Bryobacterales bacterium]|nr:DUF3987 domain-containing protein [Bryobacterales bacterium]
MRDNLAFTPAEIERYCAARVPGLKEVGAEWRGRCPIHHGSGDNFAVEMDSGRWFCHSQCGRGGDILALEMELTGTSFPEAKAEVFRIVGRTEEPPVRGGKTGRGSVGGWQTTRHYQYEDEQGRPVMRVIRRERGAGHAREKNFYQESWNGSKWIQGVAGVRRVPYRLAHVLKADTVFIVEGEKDVETLEALGLAATCNPGGSGSTALYAQWTGIFAGKHLTILPDNDRPGRKHAAGVAEALMDAAASVRVLELPGLAEKGDVSDWAAAGGTVESLLQLTARAEPMGPEQLAALRARWGLDGPEEPEAEWPEPIPLAGELPPVMAFDPELLPYSFRDFAVDTADRMQCPIDFVAVALVVCLGGAVSRRARVQPKAEDSGWLVTPNLWGAIVAQPGQLKTPTLAAAAKPLREIEEEARRAHEKAMEAHVREVELAELCLSAWKEKAKKSWKARTGGAVDEASMPERPPDPPKSPTMRRFIVNDATFEALHQTMSENPAGILVFRDELVGWWSQLDKPGREGERGFCLQAWNGDTGHTIDRIGRGTIYVEACCMSMLGGIQPGRLRNYLVDALSDGPGNDGLIQRFQLLVWPDVTGKWQYVDRRPDKTAEAEVTRIFKRLVQMDAENPKLLRFSEAAQELFIEWLTGLELRLRGGAIHPALEAHLSKYRSLMPSLAVLFCLAEWAADGGELEVIPLQSTQQAAAWCEYLESHANRLYSCITTPQMRAARELAKKLKAGEVGAAGSFTARDVYGNGWSGLDTPETVKAAADVLADSGWIRCESARPGPGGGRPSTRYVVNPKVQK